MSLLTLSRVLVFHRGVAIFVQCSGQDNHLSIKKHRVTAASSPMDGGSLYCKKDVLSLIEKLLMHAANWPEFGSWAQLKQFLYFERTYFEMDDCFS